MATSKRMCDEVVGGYFMTRFGMEAKWYEVVSGVEWFLVLM
jgi:hypothetical protein